MLLRPCAHGLSLFNPPLCHPVFVAVQVYLNIVGGLKVQETAADLAVAMAVVSSYNTIPVRPVRATELVLRPATVQHSPVQFTVGPAFESVSRRGFVVQDDAHMRACAPSM